MQSRSLKVTEMSYRIFKSDSTELTKKYNRDQIVEGNVVGPGYWMNLFSKQLSR